MAIVQISQITNRLGLQADLPQLAGGELGWSTDTRQLYIGNGTLQQGAPVIGNTEILTEFSDILNLAAFYTYKGNPDTGYVVQTGPTPGSPVIQSLQSWLDQYASVKDFGAKGDGYTDDTAAINRALNQLYCRDANNPATRRSLFFPAGIYKVSGTINIPSYATLFGEGPQNSIIQMQITPITDPPTTPPMYVAQTADSLQQTGNNIGNNGATPPVDITINNLAFQTLDSVTNSSILLVQDADSCHFTGVSFIGAETTASINPSSTVNYCVTFGSTPSLLTTDVTFQNCLFSGAYYGVSTDQYNKSVTVANSQFESLFAGVVVGSGSTPDITTGFRITNNIFDNIYAEGIIFGSNASLNASGYNVFYNVANNFAGTSNPARPIILIQGNNNVSIGDMFARTSDYAITQPWVLLSDVSAITITNGQELQLGTKVVNSGSTAQLEDNEVSSPQTIFTLDTRTALAFKIDYSIVRNTGFRTGTMWITASSVDGELSYTDDYTENLDIGITLVAYEASNVINVQYYSSNTGIPGHISYSVSYFNFPNS